MFRVWGLGFRLLPIRSSCVCVRMCVYSVCVCSYVCMYACTHTHAHTHTHTHTHTPTHTQVCDMVSLAQRQSAETLQDFVCSHLSDLPSDHPSAERTRILVAAMVYEGRESFSHVLGILGRYLPVYVHTYIYTNKAMVYKGRQSFSQVLGILGRYLLVYTSSQRTFF